MPVAVEFHACLPSRRRRRWRQRQALALLALGVAALLAACFT